ncbi:SWIM zinc finger family protein [Goodfellowiella coeruleoviolacea]|uniref:SWIM-type domain-containing protein n=1 Tax=Goodfellowiella coeruleoviolacea TaxID=334858 RepID=A0AAE3GN84_9PSEU|nr:SWIM zinc finger family protein [Goodfellowiella coeruleoviolacea]MCP2169108.1 hypothetical protein [Goodfellowiella coeruleoviolacea]
MPDFGATGWGRAWVRAVESTAVTTPNPLLPKARSLARNDAVTTVDIAPGRLTAEVVDRGRHHRVTIDIPLWTGQVRLVADRLVARSLAEHRGLAPGDLPDALAADLASHGIDIAVPTDAQTATCTCASRRRPCSHVLATHYALAQRVDEQPALALTLRAPRRTGHRQGDPDWIDLREVDAAAFYGG